nr:hypothetical protein [Tanacetum cinerariifolium]
MSTLMLIEDFLYKMKTKLMLIEDKTWRLMSTLVLIEDFLYKIKTKLMLIEDINDDLSKGIKPYTWLRCSRSIQIGTLSGIRASQMNKSDVNDVHVNESQVIGNSLNNSHESDREDNQVNDRFKKSEGYHAVPPSYIGNYMPQELTYPLLAGGKDRPPMLAPGYYVQWKSRIKRYIDNKPNHELIHYCLKNPPYKFTWADKEVLISEGSPVTTTETYMENYKNVSQDIRDQLNAEAEAVQIILTGIDNDIYTTVDTCPNACEMWKAIERLKHGKSINVQDLETNLSWEFGKFTSWDGESLESYYSRFYKMMNELVRNQCDVTNHQVNVQFLIQLQPECQRSQQTATRNRGKAIVNSSQPIYDEDPSMVAEDDEISKDKEIDKLMALISLSFKKIYKPTNNNLQTSSNTSRANHDNSPRINKGAGYDNQRLGNVAGAKETVGLIVVQKSRIQCYNCKEFRHVARECQKPKRAKDATYHKEKMLLFECQHPEKSKSIHDTYPIEQDEHNVIIDSLDMSYDREQIDQNDEDDDLAAEREIDDFKTQNKSLESSNNRFKEANNKPSETNALMYKDLKKFQAELDRRNDVEYASKERAGGEGRVLAGKGVVGVLFR